MHSNQQNKVYIGGLDKVELLKELYNNAVIRKLGIYTGKTDNISIKEASTIIGDRVIRFNLRGNLDLLLGANPYNFVFFRGRILSIDLSGDYLNTWLYNKFNGEGCAEAIIKKLQKAKPVSPQVTDVEVEKKEQTCSIL